VIVVAGFNTSIDKFMEADAIAVGGVSRVRNVIAVPGGKGAHVALTAATLGEPVRLVGIVDERHRDWFQTFFASRGVDFHAIPIAGNIRTCVAVRDRAGRMTELLEPGPELTAAERAALLDRFRNAASGAAVVALSGSLPAAFGADAYAELIGAVAHPAARVLLDTSGAALLKGVAARPFLVKPNADEAASLVGRAIDSVDAAMSAAMAIDVDAAVISLGARGVAAKWEGRACHVPAPTVSDVRNVVGSGDCLLGGIAVALARGRDADEALRLGVACGAANALTAEAGVIRRSNVDALLPTIRVEWR
jgi:1-phosphofructokinase family hexose kinase